MDEQKKPPTTTEKEEKEVKNDDISSIKSPYLDYDNLEDYKMRGYGAKGHQEPKLGMGGGATDAPTPSGGVGRGGATDAPTPSGGVGRGGGAASSDLSSTGAINRQEVP